MSHHQLRPAIYKELWSIMHMVLVGAVKSFAIYLVILTENTITHFELLLGKQEQKAREMYL